MTRENILFGTWKDRLTIKKSMEIAEWAVENTRRLSLAFKLVVCPSFTALQTISRIISGSKVGLSAQNMRWDDPKIVLTGEISAEMLLEVGCTYVIIGHSERRLYLNETNELVSLKVSSAVKHNLIPIICVGEQYEERRKGISQKIIEEQVDAAITGLSECKQYGHTVFAYEPAWAISTSHIAIPLDPQEANKMHRMIRDLLHSKIGQKFAENVTIVYGGSVNQNNVGTYFSQPEIDGGLVGTASQSIASYAQLVKISQEVFSAKATK